jgi:hypothetical protein
MFHEYPKSLYLRGWEDLSAERVVRDAAEEADARAAGYRSLAEPVEAVEPPAPRRGRPPKARDE